MPKLRVSAANIPGFLFAAQVGVEPSNKDMLHHVLLLTKEKACLASNNPSLFGRSPQLLLLPCQLTGMKLGKGGEWLVLGLIPGPSATRPSCFEDRRRNGGGKTNCSFLFCLFLLTLNKTERPC